MTARSGSTPSVSVVVPVYQGDQFLEEALQSLSAQTFGDLEIVVVDDGSTDSTPEVLAAAASREPRLRVLALPRNEGVHRARAMGLAVSHGEFIGFLDADDLLHPEAIDRLISGLEEAEADIAICGIRHYSHDGRPTNIKLRFRRHQVFKKKLLGHFCSLQFGTGSLCNKLYRREILEQAYSVKFTEALAINEDYLVNLGAFRVARRVSVLPDVLYYYRCHEGSTCNRSNAAHYFSQALRAYVVGLETYAQDDPNFRLHVDTLYKNLLRFDVYRIDDLGDLNEFSPHIAESLRRLAAVHPGAIYGLCHLFDVRYPSSTPDRDSRGRALKWLLDLLRRWAGKRR